MRSFRIGCRDGDPLMTLLQESMPPPVIARMKKAYENPDPAARRTDARPQYAILQRSLARLARANAKITLGCDTGLEDHLFGMSEQHELESMVKAGMTPMQVIVAATSRPAEYLKLDEDGHARGREGSRFPRARREPARRHHEHAADFEGLHQRRGDRSGRNDGAIDEGGDELGAVCSSELSVMSCQSLSTHNSQLKTVAVFTSCQPLLHRRRTARWCRSSRGTSGGRLRASGCCRSRAARGPWPGSRQP